jgi:hypothetical protein
LGKIFTFSINFPPKKGGLMNDYSFVTFVSLNRCIKKKINNPIITKIKIKNTQMKKIILISIAITISGCIYAQNQSKSDIANAMQKSKNMANLLSKVVQIPLDKYCYIIPPQRIRLSDVSNFQGEVAMVFPEIGGFSVQFHDAHQSTSMRMEGNKQITQTSTYEENSDITPVTAALEAGKFYTIEYEIISQGLLKKNKYAFSVVELTDQKRIENVKKHLITQEEYDNYKNLLPTRRAEIEGTYESKNGNTQLQLTGNRFHLSQSHTFGQINTTYDGTFWLNDETLILYSDTITTTIVKSSKKSQTFSKNVQNLYYKLKDNILEIIEEDGDGISKGKYKKSASRTFSQTDKEAATSCSPEITIISQNNSNQTEAIENSPMDTDYALLHVYWSGMPGALKGYDLYLGDALICHINKKTKATIQIKQEVLCALWAKTETKFELPIDIQFGHEYYIKCSLTVGMIAGRPKLEMIDNEKGKTEYSAIKLK